MTNLLGVNPKHPIKDSDGDKVINMLDCEPHNKSKQGFFHGVKAAIKRRYHEEKEAFLQRRAATAQI